MIPWERDLGDLSIVNISLQNFTFSELVKKKNACNQAEEGERGNNTDTLELN